MAMGDDPGGGGGGDWWSANAPPSPTAATEAEAAQAYRDLLGREPEPGLAAQWANGIGAGGVDAMRTAISNTPEAQAYKNRAPSPTQPPAPTQTPPPSPYQPASAQPSMLSSLPGANPAPYVSNTNAPSPYSPAAWTGGDYVQPTKPTVLQSPYALPTEADLKASPGYLARMDAGQRAGERAAAGKGSILNGGTQLALNRDAQTFASNEYGNLVGEQLGARQQNAGEYNADDANAFRNYLTRYGQFQDTNAQNQLAQKSRYQQFSDANAQSLSDYITNVTTQRNAGNDLWAHLNDLYQTGAQTASGSYKPGTV